ncbi:ATP-binding protein [Ammoniphilus sp. CFH 90114]|uniref:ATP-binding protein n=1 Tax=Ammoniphilus sp. CFH 90114 TaxID=2493665 RepID=UPI0026C0CA6C
MSQNDGDKISKDEVHLNQLASVGQIAAGIAHEVKNPLTAVKGFLQLLKEKHDDAYIDIAQTELEDAISTLENLLDVSKPDLQDEPYQSLNTSVELEALFPLFQDQVYRVQIKRHLTHTDSTVYGKKNQLKKALFNLLKNAFEAIPGEGTITVEHYEESNYIFISIEDTGIGIPEKKIRMLGTPFYTTKSDGTGMGLTQVFSVIYDHNGKIEVRSVEGKGSKFIIKLPKETIKQSRGVITLKPNFKEGQDMKSFFLSNQNLFEKRLLTEAVNVKNKIDEILKIGNIDLLNNAHKLVLYIVEGREHELITFARHEGVAWAKFSLTLAFKLEWIQAIRRVIWDFLFNYDRLSKDSYSKEDIYNLEKSVNELMDRFLNYFFMSYSEYKDHLIQEQRSIVEDLSVPIIPLTQ